MNGRCFIYVKQISHASNLIMPQILKIVAANCRQEDLIVCDHDPTSINYLRSEEYNAQPCWKPKGSIVTGIRWLQEYLIIVDDSPDIENEFKNYIWAERRSETPIDKFNIALTGLGMDMPG